MNNCKVPLPNSIDGVTGADNITELWKGHFEQLFNCIHDNDITSLHYDVTYTNDIFGTVDEIELVIGQLDKNKSCGLDGVYAEYLMHCSRRVLQLLAMWMSTFFVHGFLPDSMLSVVFVPVIKLIITFYIIIIIIFVTLLVDLLHYLLLYYITGRLLHYRSIIALLVVTLISMKYNWKHSGPSVELSSRYVTMQQ